MGIISYLQSLGATHLFTLDNSGTSSSDDKGNSTTPTNIDSGNYSFQTNPVCEGVLQSLSVTSSTSATTEGAVFANKGDINLSPLPYSTGTRSLLIWFKQTVIQNPTCIYEQGGGNNNFAFMGGALTTWQAADAGQPFLIVQSKSLAQENRSYNLVGVWEYHTQHSGSGNRILFYINGILQGITESTGTGPFPAHSGDIACGNSRDPLQSFAGTNLQSQTTAKNCNFMGMFNNVSLTQAECREIFERTTFADVTIAPDTVSNQQAALDVLIGNTYENTNCAIRIIQATDATDYRLFIDNITFNADPNLEDISIQFVGNGILTLENTNGTVIKYTSTPIEVETTSITYSGGGSVVIANNTKRVKTNQTITNSTATKLVFDGSGTTYTVSAGTISNYENVTGNTVVVTLLDNATVPTLIETSGSIILNQPVFITNPNIIQGSRVKAYNVTKSLTLDNSLVSGGSGYSLQVNLQSTDVDVNDTIRLEVAYQYQLTAKKQLTLFGVLTSTGLTFIDSQEDLTDYASLGVDGSTVTEYNLDPNTGHLQIDAFDADCESLKKRIVSRYYYLITTADGIDRLFGIMFLEDAANAVIRRRSSGYNLMVDNTGNCQIVLSDSDFRIYTDDGSPWILSQSTGGYGFTAESGRVSIANQTELENKVQKLVDAENADIFVTPTRFTKKKEGTNTVLLEKTYTTDGQGTESLTEVT